MRKPEGETPHSEEQIPIGKFEQQVKGWKDWVECDPMDVLFDDGLGRFRPNTMLKDANGEWWYEGDEGWFDDGDGEPTSFRVVFYNATFYAEFFPLAHHSLYHVAKQSTHTPPAKKYRRSSQNALSLGSRSIVPYEVEDERKGERRTETRRKNSEADDDKG